MGIELQNLAQTIQHNCHISDAKHAGDYTLCVYLLKMREFYRWERGLGFRERIDGDAVGDWLTRREALWDELEAAPLRPLTIGGRSYDPFAVDEINSHLAADGLVYSAGYVLRGKPHFFLAELEAMHEHDNCRIVVSGREHARELSAPAALSQGHRVYIRRESLRRTVWEKVDESRWNKADSPLARAVACYDFAGDLEGSLEAMCDHEIRTLVDHETGEIRAGSLIGDRAWSELLTAVDQPGLELMLRALRDNLADCLVTLPGLAADNDPARIHFFMANLTNMRKALFPALRAAYDRWLTDQAASALGEIAARGTAHWLDLAHRVLAVENRDGRPDATALQRLIESSPL